MSDDQPFLDAIIADPSNDAPRLVYADWLDDHGSCDRAEFIRLQCQYVKLPPCTCFMFGCGEIWGDEVGQGCDEHRAKVNSRHRQDQLWFKHSNEWFYSNCRVHCLIRDETFRSAFGIVSRGFISSIRCPLHKWIECAGDVCLRHPVEKVTLSDRNPARSGHSEVSRWNGWYCSIGLSTNDNLIPSSIPQPIWNFLTSDTMAYTPWAEYLSVTEATDDLSLACIKFGRMQANKLRGTYDERNMPQVPRRWSR